VCTPEVRSAAEYVAAFHAMLRIADEARQHADQKLQASHSIQVMANTSDGRGNSFGSHLNVAITRRAFSDIFHRKWQYLPWLASYQVSSVVFTGAGKVGSENGAPPADFQLSQRADFMESISSLDTTAHRGLVNQRDEALSGNKEGERARLHCIFYDSNLQETAAYLKAGVLQIILTMIEAGSVDLNLVLRDPLDALAQISRDLTFTAKFATSTGATFTVLELQLMFLEQASRFVAAGGCEGLVPEADKVLGLWADTLEKLRAGKIAELAYRLDWALKLSIIGRILESRKGLDFTSREVRYADQLYANLDTKKGLYWSFARSSPLERVVTPQQIEHLRTNPPETTRAWTRAMLLRRAKPETVADVDWDAITFHVREQRGRSFRLYRRRFAMDDALGHSRSSSEHAFRSAASVEEVLDELEGLTPAPGLGAPARFTGNRYEPRGHQ
jgi:proteasome accessory factor A